MIYRLSEIPNRGMVPPLTGSMGERAVDDLLPSFCPCRDHCVAPNRGTVSPLTGAIGDSVGDGPTELMSLSGHIVGRNERRGTGRPRMAPVGAKAW